jgi:ankyrin repeat protein
MLPLLITVVFMVQTASLVSTPNPPAPIAIPLTEVRQHMVEKWPLLRAQAGPNLTPAERSSLAFGSVTFDVIIDTKGNVISAKYNPKVIELPPEVVVQAEAEMRAIHFKPFERNGHTVTAEFLLDVVLLPPELKTNGHVPFPKVKEWSSVKITLSRTACFGKCRAYSIELSGDGMVLYDGKSNVAFIGAHRGFVPLGNIVDLVKLFEKADYYSLRDKYNCGASDMPTQTTSIEIDGRRKQVVDYCGENMGMSAAATQLESDIDRLAGSERWTQGNAETLAALQSEHWDLQSHEAAATLARLADLGSTQAVVDLVSAGVPLHGNGRRGDELHGGCCPAVFSAARDGDIAMLRALLDAGAASDAETLAGTLVAAAESGKLEKLNLVLASGASIKTGNLGGLTVLMGAASSGSPAMLKEVLKSNPDVNAEMLIPKQQCPDYLANGFSECPKTNGHTALMEAVEASDYRNISAEGIDRIEVVHMLLAAGANANARDIKGKTPLMLCGQDPARALLLLKAGADPNARDLQGHTAMYYAWGEVREVLLANGAQPLPGEQSNE